MAKDQVSTAYRELADLLVALRRIVGRWIERESGEGSFDRVCPPTVAERLLERRSEEATLSRVPMEAEGLLEYSTFTDLADLLLDNLELIDRLVPRLVPSPEQLIRRLAELEVIRRQLARAKPVLPSEIEAVRDFHERLLAALKKAPAEAAKRSARPPKPTPEPRSRARSHDEAEAPSDGQSGQADLPAPVPAEEVAPADLFGVDEALAVDDDAGAMRALHQEVMLLADQAISGRIERPSLVWSVLTRSGWVARNAERLRLDPVQRFHAVVDELRVHAADGARGDELRRLREEQGFTALLLEMRESFLSSRTA